MVGAIKTISPAYKIMNNSRFNVHNFAKSSIYTVFEKESTVFQT